MIGKRLTPILIEIEETLIEFEANQRGNPQFENEAFRAALKIFMAVVMQRMYEMQHKEDMPLEQRKEMSFKFGNDLKKMIFTFTGIDTHELYE